MTCIDSRAFQPLALHRNSCADIDELTLPWPIILYHPFPFYMPPLRRTLTVANLNDENQIEKGNQLLLFPPAAHLPDVIEKGAGQRKEGAISSFAMYGLPFAVSAVLVQPSSTTVHPFIFKPPVMTTSSPRQSSPLGPCQNLLPGRPVFPPSVRERDLYRQALKKSARQAQRLKHIRRTERKNLGGAPSPQGSLT